MTRRRGSSLALGLLLLAALALWPGTAGAAPSLAEMIGQKLVVRMEGTTPSPRLLRRIRAGKIGGVILYSNNFSGAAGLRNITAELRSAAAAGGRPRLMIAIDQEGGQVKQVSWIAPTIAPPSMGDVATALAQGHKTGHGLHGLGINTDLAPVADVPHSTQSFMYRQGRTFSFKARKASRLANSFATGLADRHIVAAMKHFPGLGFATRNTDSHVVHIRASKSELAPGLRPYRRAIAHHDPLIMLSNAIYDAYGHRHAATLSHRIGTKLLRHDLGFRGVTITDSLTGAANARGVAEDVLAIRAAQVGTDMILLTGNEASSNHAYRSVLAAARQGRISRARLSASYQRIIDLKQQLRPKSPRALEHDSRPE